MKIGNSAYWGSDGSVDAKVGRSNNCRLDIDFYGEVRSGDGEGVVYLFLVGVGYGYGTSVNKVVKDLIDGFIVEVGGIIGWGVCSGVGDWVDIYDGITSGPDYEYNMGSSGGFFDCSNDGKPVVFSRPNIWIKWWNFTWFIWDWQRH